MSDYPLLAIDTSTNAGSVCLKTANALYEHHIPSANEQAANLIPAIEGLLNEAGIWYPHLSALAVTIGPGSFTGIRIGLSVARTIAAAYPGMSIFAFTTLECLAADYDGQAPNIVCTLGAGKGDIYAQAFSRIAQKHWAARGEITILRPDALIIDPQGAITGNSAQMLPASLASHISAPNEPSAQALIKAVTSIQLSKRHAPRPLYIRPPDATPPTRPPV